MANTKPKKKNKGGRKTLKTPETIRKIEEVAALDGTIEEMAFYADINPDTIYDWMKKDPKFSERIKQLRNRPVLKARKRAIEGVDESYQNAMDYLKRKRKAEFGENNPLEGVNINPTYVIYGEGDPDYKERLAKAREKYGSTG